jgi:hypothetical protein
MASTKHTLSILHPEGETLGPLHESSACISGTSTSVRVLVICVVTEPFYAFVHGQYSNESERL